MFGVILNGVKDLKLLAHEVMAGDPSPSVRDDTSLRHYYP